MLQYILYSPGTLSVLWVQCLIHFSSLSLEIGCLPIVSTCPELYFSIWKLMHFSQVHWIQYYLLLTISGYVCIVYTLFAWFIQNHVFRWRDCSVTVQPPVVIPGEIRGEERSPDTQNKIKWLSGLNWLLGNIFSTKSKVMINRKSL